MNRVVLLSQQGSGTNLLRRFLISHSKIKFVGEIFEHRQDYSYCDYKNDLDALFEGKKYIKDIKGLEVLGFDVKYNQIGEGLLRYIKEEKLSVLHLFRDPARTYLRSFNSNSKPIEYEKLINYCNKVRKNRDWYQKEFKESGNLYLYVTYEDMTRGYEIEELSEDFEKRILDWLGVNYQKLYLYKKDGLKIRF